MRDDPTLLPAAIEETLRDYAPFHATFRHTTRDVGIAGQTIPARARVLVFLASAVREKTVFERPDEFRLDRPSNRHVAFGMGIHYCVGALLARLEACYRARCSMGGRLGDAHHAAGRGRPAT